MSADRDTDGSMLPEHGEWLSSLADGEARGDDLEQACREWRTRHELRRDWHAYHLIGDVMRSDELSSPSAHDVAFLHALRGRLASEPVPLAPAPIAQAAHPTTGRGGDRVRRWLAPAAAVAGFAVVGLSLLVLRPGGSTGWSEPMAVVQPVGADGLRRVAGAPSSASSSPVWVIDGQVIRDARLDAYFEAHRGATGPMPSAVPGGALRSVEMLVPQR